MLAYQDNQDYLNSLDIKTVEIILTVPPCYAPCVETGEIVLMLHASCVKTGEIVLMLHACCVKTPVCVSTVT